MDPFRVAVIGGVAAGTAAAAHVARLDPTAEVTLFEQDEVISYGACEMPYFVQGLIDRPEKLIALSPEQFAKTRNAAVHTRARVLTIEPAAKKLTAEDLETGRVTTELFDSFILATGAKARKLGRQNDDAENVLYFRTLRDAVVLNTYLDVNRVGHAVVLGGGYIGLELCEALAGRGVRTSLIQPDPGVLPKSVDAPFRVMVEKHLEKAGVAVRRDRASGFRTDKSGAVDAVKLESGELVGCQLVLVAIGIKPNVRLATEMGIDIGNSGAIKVTDGMQTNIRNVFACGDCIEVRRVVDGEYVHWPLARPAFRTARIAAENCVRKGGAEVLYEGTTCASAVKIFGLEVASVGLRLDQARETGFDARDVTVSHWSRTKQYPGSERLHVHLVFENRTGRILGVEVLGKDGAALRANILVPLVRSGARISDLEDLDLIYTPPIAPSTDPLLIAASAARKVLEG